MVAWGRGREAADLASLLMMMMHSELNNRIYGPRMAHLRTAAAQMAGRTRYVSLRRSFNFFNEGAFQILWACFIGPGLLRCFRHDTTRTARWRPSPRPLRLPPTGPLWRRRRIPARHAAQSGRPVSSDRWRDGGILWQAGWAA